MGPSRGDEEVRPLGRAKLERRVCVAELLAHGPLHHLKLCGRGQIDGPTVEMSAHSQRPRERSDLLGGEINEQAFREYGDSFRLVIEMREEIAARAFVGQVEADAFQLADRFSSASSSSL